jgi:hypothetical protein
LGTPDQFDARINPAEAMQFQTSAPVTRVRDVLVWTGTETDVSSDEFHAHPPIGLAVWGMRTPEPVDLGRDLRIDQLDYDEAELVMNACTPRGHFFAPIRQFSQSMAFVRDISVDSWREPIPLRPRRRHRCALMLSRLVRDNSQSTQFAARIANFADGEQTVVYTLASETKHAYRLRRDRDWLDRDEGTELRELLRAYWNLGDSLPERVRRAMWRTEYASWLRWADLALPILVSGLESLLKTDRHPSMGQFTARVPALAAELGFEGITREFCERMYEARSEWVHGAHVRLFSTGLEAEQAAQQGATEGPATDAQAKAVTDIARVQDVLRRAVRVCIEDKMFRDVFDGDDRIRMRWPL